MARQIIDIGTFPSDGTGDPLRVSFNKINQNFEELYANTSPTVGSTVYSVSGRSGNVTLTVNDIIGAAGTASIGVVIRERTVTSSIGQEGDLSGMMAVDNDYLYRCTADYDGSSNIWVRVNFNNTEW